MRRAAWLLAALALCCLCGVTGRAAERDTYQSAKAAAAESKARAEAAKKKNSSWWWPFGSSDSDKEAAKPKVSTSRKEEKMAAVEPPRQTKPISAPLGQEGANLIAQEQAKFLRRQQVCDRIRELAQEKGDTSLEKQAQLLEQRAWFIYEQRTAQARMPSLLPIDDTADAKKLTGEAGASGRRTSDRGGVHSIYARNPSTTSDKQE